LPLLEMNAIAFDEHNPSSFTTGKHLKLMSL